LKKSYPDLKYPTPHLPSTLLPDESGPDSAKQEPEVDPVEEEEDLSHVELAEHLNKLFIEDKRFFGQARYAQINSIVVLFDYLIEQYLYVCPIYNECKDGCKRHSTLCVSA
jgi:hypothetical protein